VRAATAAGLDVDAFGHRVTFFHDISLSLFEEVAKLRAQRRMWAAIMRDWFGAREERTLKFKVHTQTSGADLVQADPLNNVVRITIQAIAAILGGTQSLHTDAFDEAYATPTEAAARLALMTQHILSDETGLPDVVDPLGGSYYVEALTDEMESRAWRIVEEVEARGGMLRACEDGYIQDEIGRSAWEFQMELERGDRAIVGVTRHAGDAAGRDENLSVQRVDQSRIEVHIERVRRSRQDRDQQRAGRARDRLIGLASDRADNAFEATIDAVRVGLTHGEIVAATREAFGDGQPRAVL
jgi:methylmalonyl-CoA mutase N-terminal domain/subunit